MEELFYKNFFKTKDFKHKNLWGESDIIWSPLYHISDYIKNLTLTIDSEITVLSTIINKEFIRIGKNVIIEPYSLIKGPAIIEDGTIIRHGAYIRENTIIGRNCIIGHNCEIKNSVVLNNSRIAHFAYVGDSILGNNVNIAAGVKCANVRFDKKDIEIFIKTIKVKTKLKKLGAIIGDNSQIGCNSVLNPGTIIGKNTICYGSLNIKGFIPKNSLIKEDNSRYCVKKKNGFI